MIAKDSQRQQRFLDIADQYKEVIAKVCSVYTSENAPFADLYQEVLINIWTVSTATAVMQSFQPGSTALRSIHV